MGAHGSAWRFWKLLIGPFQPCYTHVRWYGFGMAIALLVDEGVFSGVQGWALVETECSKIGCKASWWHIFHWIFYHNLSMCRALPMRPWKYEHSVPMAKKIGNAIPVCSYCETNPAKSHVSHHRVRQTSSSRCLLLTSGNNNSCGQVLSVVDDWGQLLNVDQTRCLALFIGWWLIEYDVSRHMGLSVSADTCKFLGPSHIFGMGEAKHVKFGLWIDIDGYKGC